LRFEVRGFGAEVVVIELGLIRTGLAGTAVDTMGGATSSGPHASFGAGVAQVIRDNYESGSLAGLG
jgi:hypothetical protein